MKPLSNLLVEWGADCVAFWCPGCERLHPVRVDGPGAWGWNRDVEKPTFTPSILTWSETSRCHSFVRDGQIVFLLDCSHRLASQTVDLPICPPTDAAGERHV